MPSEIETRHRLSDGEVTRFAKESFSLSTTLAVLGANLGPHIVYTVP